ncbi:MAG TPA: type II toxin-antitoxin system VapC family toxin [Terriglobia bacterium]|nr:type II toxin-antitoxin system VapC family toxin [Terriglobia bacterium]
MSIYADTSFLVSLYIPDENSAEAEHRMASNPSAWLTPLHVAEWTHAVEQQVFRKVATREEADLVHERFKQHRESRLWKEVALPESAFDLCAELARRHAARLGVRTLDTLHVASALALAADRFWTFDERQEKLARAAGLKTA